MVPLYTKDTVGQKSEDICPKSHRKYKGWSLNSDLSVPQILLCRLNLFFFLA